MKNPQLTTMTAAIKDHLGAPSILVLAAMLICGCANKERTGRQNDCARAKARYGEMRRALSAKKAAGMTTTAQIEMAERRLRKAKADYISSCGGRPTKRAN